MTAWDNMGQPDKVTMRLGASWGITCFRERERESHSGIAFVATCFGAVTA